jgi:hypothetical protein
MVQDRNSTTNDATGFDLDSHRKKYIFAALKFGFQTTNQP